MFELASLVPGGRDMHALCARCESAREQQGEEMTAATKARTFVPLLAIAAAQLMIVLDDTIVNIALPSIQDELRVDPVHLPWVVN